MSYPSRRSLNSTVEQVLTNQRGYVIRFLRLHLSQLSIDLGFL